MTLPWPDLTEEQWRAHARDLRKKNDGKSGVPEAKGLKGRYRRPGFDVLENGDIVGALKGRAPEGDGSGGDS